MVSAIADGRSVTFIKSSNPQSISCHEVELDPEAQAVEALQLVVRKLQVAPEQDDIHLRLHMPVRLDEDDHLQP
jgi:hypothetical protein